jgi:hypothetical protein
VVGIGLIASQVSYYGTWGWQNCQVPGVGVDDGDCGMTIRLVSQFKSRYIIKSLIIQSFSSLDYKISKELLNYQFNGCLLYDLFRMSGWSR